MAKRMTACGDGGVTALAQDRAVHIYGYGDDDSHADMGYAWAIGVYFFLLTLCGSFGAGSRVARRDFWLT
jgi:hypothetical protein